MARWKACGVEIVGVEEFAMLLYGISRDEVENKHVQRVKKLCRDGRVSAEKGSYGYTIVAEFEDYKPVVREKGYYTRLRERARRRQDERRRRYGNMADAELEEEWERLLDDYAERLEYFDALPEWQAPENMKLMKDDPEAWGLTRTEFMEWCGAILEHWSAAEELADAGNERRRRIREAERRKVSELPDYDAAKAACDATEPNRRDRETRKQPGETMREYVGRVGRTGDERAARAGARLGAADVRDREFLEKPATRARLGR